MSEPHALPSLFGRFTAIFKDHDHLATTLRQLRRMCAALEANATDPPLELAPEPLLRELRTDLIQHFSAEESSAYFGTVVEEAPALAPRITALVTEHGVMLELLERLLQMASTHTRWASLPMATRKLIAQLEQHERAESRLLRELFLGDEPAAPGATNRHP